MILYVQKVENVQVNYKNIIIKLLFLLHSIIIIYTIYILEQIPLEYDMIPTDQYNNTKTNIYTFAKRTNGYNKIITYIHLGTIHFVLQTGLV